MSFFRNIGTILLCGMVSVACLDDGAGAGEAGDNGDDLAVTVIALTPTIPLYETAVLRIEAPEVGGDRFLKFPQVTFSQGARSIQVEGFFNGNNSGSANGSVWLVRFKPDATGTWQYQWSFEGSSGAGTLTVTARANPRNHGHVKRSGRFLVHDDGTTFHYRGANWPESVSLRPAADAGVNVNEAPYFSDNDWINYVNRLRDTGHNGSYIMRLDAPMNNDRKSFNLAWLERIDFAVQAAGDRGIYVFLGLMNTWGRTANNPYTYTTSSSQQLLQPWSSNHMDAKEFFFRYLAARYAGFYNVLWELGNEMEHSNSGSTFASLANNNYLPWIRQYDPYGLPITLSEFIWNSTTVDIAGFHQGENINLNNTNRPVIHTELVDIAGATDVLWRNTACNDSRNRVHYRRVIWKGMAEGGSGSVECTVMFFDNTLTSMNQFLAQNGIRTVMEDHGRLGAFLEGLSTHLHLMPPLNGIGSNASPGNYRARGLAGTEYVAYFWGGLSAGGASITLSLPQGSYRAHWYSPQQGVYSAPVTVSSGNVISSPWGSEYDAALHIERL